jgi:hypothetical protein
MQKGVRHIQGPNILMTAKVKEVAISSVETTTFVSKTIRGHGRWLRPALTVRA